MVQNIVLKRLTLISFLQLRKKSTVYKVPFKSQKFFCWSDFAKHLEKPLILQKSHMAQCQTYSLRQQRQS